MGKLWILDFSTSSSTTSLIIIGRESQVAVRSNIVFERYRLSA